MRSVNKKKNTLDKASNPYFEIKANVFKGKPEIGKFSMDIGLN